MYAHHQSARGYRIIEGTDDGRTISHLLHIAGGPPILAGISDMWEELKFFLRRFW